MLHPLGDDQHEAHGNHGAKKGGEDQRCRIGYHSAAQQENHGDGNRQLRTGGDTQHKRPRDGVAKKGLEQKTGNG